MTRYKLTIEYDGTEFSGWQKQARDPSIQEAIEEAIEKFSGQRVRVHGAGRTDSGVHARGQVAHVDLSDFKKPMEGFEVAKAINAFLKPRAIAIVQAEIVPPDFHARFGAKNKLYTYRILNRGPYPTLDQGLVWHIIKNLDTGAMHRAAQIFLGTHDFTSFRDSQCQAKNPVKTIDRFDVMRHGHDITIEVEGQSFLHHQVRNMVGTLTLVGEGKWGVEDVTKALEARSRDAGGPTAPPQGLYLTRIDYSGFD